MFLDMLHSFDNVLCHLRQGMRNLQEHFKISGYYTFTCGCNAELHMAFGPYNAAFQYTI